MKMTRLMLTLSFAAMGLLPAAAQTPDHFSSKAAVRSLADDLDDDSSNRYASHDEASDMHADASVLAPTATSGMDDGMYADYGGEYGDPAWSDCGNGYCNSSDGCGSSRRQRGWFTAEQLLFFAADRHSPPLAVVAPYGVDPLEENGQTTFGGILSSGVIPGYRVSTGIYLDSCQRIGAGVRVFGTYGRDLTHYQVGNNDGSQSIGVPFFNPSLLPNAGSDAFIVSGDLPNGDPISVGSIRASESLALLGAEASGYLLLARGTNHRFDLVAGYSFIELRNSIYQRTNSTNLFDGDGIVDGTIFDFQDRFTTSNRLSGAHLGVLSSVVRNRVSLSTLAKVSFGNQTTRTSIHGQGTTSVPTVTPGVFDVDQGDGFFARSTNNGVYTNDQFAFVPELGIKLGYAFRPNLELTVGYTLLVWSSAAMAGDQIDSVIDPTGISGRPVPQNRTSSFWMQSVDLGLGWSY